MNKMNETSKRFCGANVLCSVKSGLTPESFEKIRGTIIDPNTTESPLQCQTDEYIKPVYENEFIRTFKKWRDAIQLIDDSNDTIIIDSMGDLKE